MSHDPIVGKLCRVSWINSTNEPGLLSPPNVQKWSRAPLNLIECTGYLVYADQLQVVVAQLRMEGTFANLHKIPRRAILLMETLFVEALIAPPVENDAPEQAAPAAKSKGESPSKQESDATPNGSTRTPS